MTQQIPQQIEIGTMIAASLRDVLARVGERAPATIDRSTVLVGQQAVLDSLSLVMLIVEIEQRLDEEYGLALTLASDRAMSQRNSPFRDVGALNDYIGQLIDEGRKDD